MKKIKKIVLSLVAVAACAGAFGTYEIYQQSGESNALLAENVEALSWGENAFLNAVTCGYWDSKTHASMEKIIIKNSHSAQYTSSNSANASVRFVNVGVKSTFTAPYSSTTEKYKCNECIDGNTYAHCSQIPSPRCP